MPPRVRHRGHIEQRSDGSWRAKVYAGVDPLTGKERRLKKTAYSEAAAKAALAELLHQVDERRHPRSRITVGEAVAQWLDVVTLATTTRERYDDLIRLYVLPTFGRMEAGKVDAEILERFYARLQRCRELCSGRKRAGHECRPLANNTIRKVHYILSAAFDRAVRWRYLSVNEAEVAEPPAFHRSEPDPPTPEEAAAVISDAWAADLEWGLLLWLTMLTGSRRGEVSALRWRHVDAARGVLTVERSNAGTREGVEEKGTKSRQRRRIALDADTLQLLADHRQRRLDVCQSLDVQFDPDSFVFSLSPDGSEPIKPATITQRYRRLALRLSLRSHRLHALRHYTATELIAAGVDVRTVAGRLGHGSGGATTLRVYAAFVDEADRKAASTMAGLMPSRESAHRPPRSPYEKLAASLRDDVASGRLALGESLPTVAELAAAHNVSVGTAHRATLLSTEGLVRVSRGRRAVVAASA